MLCSLIMAGGKGTRFWPESTSKKPKQFLSLINEKTMIQMTIDRVKKIMPIDRIFVVTGERYKWLVAEQIPELPEKNIIIEPMGMNTAPCILLSSLYIKQIFKDATIAVLSSDAAIDDNDAFCKNLTLAERFIEKEDQDAIVTIGITPNRPEVGYGYIKYPLNERNKLIKRPIKIEKFVEKPNLEKAKEYLDSGNYLWNAGIFIFNVNTMLKEFENRCVETYRILKDLPAIDNPKYMDNLKERYALCESTSIDYAIMEKSKAVYVIPSDFGWDDVGTWNALKRYIKPDEEANYLKGNIDVYDSNNNIVYTGKKKVILLGAENIFCINSDDAIIIGNKEKLSEVHELRKKYDF